MVEEMWPHVVGRAGGRIVSERELHRNLLLDSDALESPALEEVNVLVARISKTDHSYHVVPFIFSFHLQAIHLPRIP